MITCPIQIEEVKGLWFGEPFRVVLYGTYYKGRITTGKTAIEAITRMLDSLQ